MVNRITYDPKVMGGRACFRGMRITAVLVVNLVANGMTTGEILREYPDLESNPRTFTKLWPMLPRLRTKKCTSCRVRPLEVPGR
jgi:Protein of unknown function (DUF433)